jgi:putative SOS response-associated peptidase YedK
MVNLKSFVDDLPWASLFDGADAVAARYNIAPTQSIPILTNREQDGRLIGRLELAHWGLIPSWAKDMSIGNKLINARAETLAEKPSFRTALRKRRCLIPADGFFEWKLLPDGKKKQPMFIRLRSGKPMAFAGLWELWKPPDADDFVVSATIITTAPNTLMAEIHNRMPAILPAGEYLRWLHPEPSADPAALLRPLEADLLEAFPVHTAVGNPRYDSPDNIKPIAAP